MEFLCGLRKGVQIRLIRAAMRDKWHFTSLAVFLRIAVCECIDKSYYICKLMMYCSCKSEAFNIHMMHAICCVVFGNVANK